MTKTQLVQTLAQKLGCSQSDVKAFIDAYADVVTATLKSGDAIVLPGLAKLSVKDKPAQPAKQKKNPFTGQMITVAAKPASKKVKAAPLAVLKKAIG